jgi:threonylcarbamoyladenosine tRNA methylthiotransferase MtaB
LGRGLGLADSLRVQVNDIMSVRETAHTMVDGFGSNARAFVQVQNGCDHRCTFCIIPYGRGPSRSVPAGEVVTQVRKLVEAAMRGGADRRGHHLLRRRSAGRYDARQAGAAHPAHVPELARLRLSSIDQVEADAHLMAAIADEPRLMPHLHLSMQSATT